MGRHDLLAGTLLVLFGLGGAAMTQVGPSLFPGHEQLIFWVGVGAVIVALIGLAFLFIRPAKKPEQPPRRPPSTFMKASGGAQIDVEDSHSKADTFFDVQDVQSLTSKRNHHEPHDSDGAPKTDGKRE
jgi:hypothetical protein